MAKWFCRKGGQDLACTIATGSTPPAAFPPHSQPICPLPVHVLPLQPPPSPLFQFPTSAGSGRADNACWKAPTFPSVSLATCYSAHHQLAQTALLQSVLAEEALWRRPAQIGLPGASLEQIHSLHLRHQKSSTLEHPELKWKVMSGAAPITQIFEMREWVGVSTWGDVDWTKMVWETPL